MKMRVLAGLVLPALMVASAGAADLPRRHAPAYVPPAMVPVFSWTGAYAGVNGGAGFGTFNERGRGRAGDPSGGTVGGTVGYNHQLNNNIVVGIEADANFADIGSTRTGAGPVTTKSTLNFQHTIRGRVGYAINRVLVYGTGGYAGGNLHTTIYDTPNNYYNANSNYLSGYAVGAGAEYAIMPNVSGKIEYIYTDLGRGKNFAGTPSATQVGVSSSNVRAGVNYHF